PPGEPAPEGVVIVGDENASHMILVGYLNQPPVLDTGSVTRKRVPALLLLTSIRPSCASTILLTIASPSPDPCGLVVKNGSKILSVSSVEIPGPSSATSTTISGMSGCGPGNAGSSSGMVVTAVIERCPLPPSASNALATRLVNT